MPAEFRPLNDAVVYARSSARGDLPFIVATMFTGNLRARADQLKASLEQLALSFVAYQVPAVHCSISATGTGDIAFCKPNFISFVQDEYRMPVLYVDADVVFREMPERIVALAREGIDFAAYNWLADPATDAYVPVDISLNGTQFKDRFYRFSHSIDMLDPTQLITSGAVQFHGLRTQRLLQGWLDTVARFPNVDDDQLLDYAYNLLIDKSLIRASWLDKEYCRLPWWIHVRPVIDHPQLPGRGDPGRRFQTAVGYYNFRTESIRIGPAQGPFPRDCLIDTWEKRLLRTEGGSPSAPTSISVVGSFATPLWIETVITENEVAQPPGA